MAEIQNHNKGFKIVSVTGDAYKNSPQRSPPVSKVGSTQAQAPQFGSDRTDESLEKGLMVPKFGTWDDSDPSSADGYSDIFKKVREEKMTREKVPIIKTDPDFSTATQYPGQTRRNPPPSKSILRYFRCFGKQKRHLPK